MRAPTDPSLSPDPPSFCRVCALVFMAGQKLSVSYIALEKNSQRKAKEI